MVTVSVVGQLWFSSDSRYGTLWFRIPALLFHQKVYFFIFRSKLYLRGSSLTYVLSTVPRKMR
jgi:hypothetical protein